uniref:Ovule protein n=1 Tax=Loa loa TaxID=7209 RepID=A0A1I7VAR8_LOALO
MFNVCPSNLPKKASPPETQPNQRTIHPTNPTLSYRPPPQTPCSYQRPCNRPFSRHRRNANCQLMGLPIWRRIFTDEQHHRRTDRKDYGP